MKKIALTPSHISQSSSYPKWLEKRGFKPVLLKSGDSLEGLDALIITGGPDVGANLERDKDEIDWFNQAYGKIPILGICRGMQLSNVILGGTLWKDLSPERGGIKHTSSRAAGEMKSEAPSSFHEVIESEDISKDFGATMLKIRHLNESMIDKLMDQMKIQATPELFHAIEEAQKNYQSNCDALQKYKVNHFTVNSRHHQGVKVLAEDLKPLAYCPIDNLIEMATSKTQKVLLVQWHPERDDVWNTRAEKIVSEWLESVIT